MYIYTDYVIWIYLVPIHHMQQHMFFLGLHLEELLETMGFQPAGDARPKFLKPGTIFKDPDDFMGKPW